MFVTNKMKYRIRVDGLEDEKFIKFFAPYQSVVLVHHQVNDNPHYHAYIEDTLDLSIDAVRARVKRYFQVEKGDYSVKKCDDDKVNEYVQYLFNRKHGNVPRLVYVHNFDSELLNGLEKSAQDVAIEFTKRQQSKKNTTPIVDLGKILADKYEVLHLDYVDIKQYTLLAIQVCREHKKGCNTFLLRNIIADAMSYTSSGKEMLVQQMQNFFHVL